MSSTNGKAPSADRWDGIDRPYTPADVEALRGSVRIEHTLARLGAERLWQLLKTEPCVPALYSGARALAMYTAESGPYPTRGPSGPCATRFIVFASEMKARAADVPSRPGYGEGQHPAMRVTVGRSDSACCTAHLNHAWHARVRPGGVPSNPDPVQPFG